MSICTQYMSAWTLSEHINASKRINPFDFKDPTFPPVALRTKFPWFINISRIAKLSIRTSEFKSCSPWKHLLTEIKNKLFCLRDGSLWLSNLAVQTESGDCVCWQNMRLSFWMYPLLLPMSWLGHSDPAGASVYVCLFKVVTFENQDRDELRWHGKLCDQRERWRPADDESKEAKQFARCISRSCLNIPINRLELMGHTVYGCEFSTTTDTWMIQWQRSHQNKLVCSWMWRSECLKQEETPDTNGGQKKEVMQVHWLLLHLFLLRCLVQLWLHTSSSTSLQALR